MKNILFVCKITQCKTQPSNNRVKLLEFLEKNYDNIKLLDDLPNSSLKDKIENYETKENWSPDVIIYYFISRWSSWINIQLPDFTTYRKDIDRYMIFEDHHYAKDVIQLYNKYNFKMLIKPNTHIHTEKIYRQYNVNFNIWGFYIDSELFKDYKLPKKYDILLYGCVSDFYPLRKKMYSIMKFLQARTKYKIKIIEHSGYVDKKKAEALPKNSELSKIINESRFTLVSSSMFHVYVKKYLEVPMSNSTIIGDIPGDYKDKLKENIIEVPFNSTEKQLLEVMLNAIKNKYLDIENKNYGEEVRKNHSFYKAYEDLMKLL